MSAHPPEAPESRRSLLNDVDDIDASFVPRFPARVAVIPVADEAVLYDEGTGELYRLEHTAAVVCARFDGESSVTSVVDQLTSSFAAPRRTIEGDVLSLVKHLAHRGLLIDTENPT